MLFMQHWGYHSRSRSGAVAKAAARAYYMAITATNVNTVETSDENRDTAQPKERTSCEATAPIPEVRLVDLWYWSEC
jgi:hypothetical protein